ncbi:MAG TPA: hypothetical protein VH597_12155 [Verrucomicrobiae bacterium]|nr:hypothetical protein [Verrucomicrobiae bacterium]
MNIEQRILKAGLAILAAVVCLGAGNSGAQTNTDSGLNFDSFSIVTRRNIFDPNRSPGYVRTRPNERARPLVDSLNLVGTMSYPKGKFAFFDGSSSQYKKVLEPGAAIAGYTVKDITPTAVTLAANGKEFEMKVGAQLRNESGSGWRMSSRQEPAPGPENDSTDAAPAVSTAPPTGSSPEFTDRLKQLMEQRQKEQQELK